MLIIFFTKNIPPLPWGVWGYIFRATDDDDTLVYLDAQTASIYFHNTNEK